MACWPEPGTKTPQATSGRAREKRHAGTDQIGLGEGAGITWVTTDGRWANGVLAGAWHKDAAGYIGEGARETARRDRSDRSGRGRRDHVGDHRRALGEWRAGRSLAQRRRRLHRGGRARNGTPGPIRSVGARAPGSRGGPPTGAGRMACWPEPGTKTPQATSGRAREKRHAGTD